MLVESLSAAENIMLGSPARGKVAGIVNWRQTKRGARELLEHLDVELDINRPINQLSEA